MGHRVVKTVMAAMLFCIGSHGAQIRNSFSTPSAQNGAAVSAIMPAISYLLLSSGGGGEPGGDGNDTLKASMIFTYRDAMYKSGDKEEVIVTFNRKVPDFTLSSLRFENARGIKVYTGNHRQFAVVVEPGNSPGMMKAILPAGAVKDGEDNTISKDIEVTASIASTPWRDSTEMSRYRGIIRTKLMLGDDKNDYIELEWIRPGSYYMGSAADDPYHQEDETRHRVTISKGFWISRYEITQHQWETIMGTNPSCFKPAADDPDKGDLPVECVSYNDIVREGGFLDKLNQRFPGLHATLPTEAQWEYAYRSGTRLTNYVGGYDIKGDANSASAYVLGWYAGSSSNWNYKKSHEVAPAGTVDISDEFTSFYEKPTDRFATHHVGLKASSDWFLKDMGGNVREWCLDWYQKDLGSGDATDPAGPSSGTKKVVRGGSWRSGAMMLRSAAREALDPDTRDNMTGFRIVIVP